jgi:hypothetical protein
MKAIEAAAWLKIKNPKRPLRSAWKTGVSDGPDADIRSRRSVRVHDELKDQLLEGKPEPAGRALVGSRGLCATMPACAALNHNRFRGTFTLLPALSRSERENVMETILIVVLLVLLLGGGGWYGRGRWYGRSRYGDPL